MRNMKIILLLILFFCIVLTRSINWLSLYRGGSDNWGHSRACRVARRMHGLTKSQTRTCRRQVEVMPHVVLAARNAIYTCQKIFQRSRWNCSSILNAPHHTPDLTEGTREQAITHAISSASITWSLSRACSQGTLVLCGCGALPQEPPNGPFKWGGCGDHILFGSRFARDFVDVSDRKRKKKNTRRRRSGQSEIEEENQVTEMEEGEEDEENDKEEEKDNDVDEEDEREEEKESEEKKYTYDKESFGVNSSIGGMITQLLTADLNINVSPQEELLEEETKLRHNREIQPFPLNIKEEPDFLQIKNTQRSRSKKKKTKKKKKKQRGKGKNKHSQQQNPAITMMNHHNNRVGRRVVESSLSTMCKCHGVSGSCNMKTCWKSLPVFLMVGERLHRKYQSGVEVKEVLAGPRLRLLPASPAIRRFSRDDLIYVTKSPDYCHPEERVGSLGTRGRRCNMSSQGVDGCEMMCCGRGHISEAIMYHQRCHCKYHWCCYVKCQTCAVWEDLHTCN